MGGVLSSVPNLINLPQTRGDANILSVKGSEVLPNGTYSVHRLSELKYHTSWDWLMPVVQKCRKDNRLEYFDMVYYALEEGDINVTYKAVIEFIKNQNN